MKGTGKKDTGKRDISKKETDKGDISKKGTDKRDISKKETDKRDISKKETDKGDIVKKDMGKNDIGKRDMAVKAVTGDRKSGRGLDVKGKDGRGGRSRMGRKLGEWIETGRALRHVGDHFRTITHHKILVMKECFKLGLYRQGLLHDLSKYSPSEFWTGVKYYQGDRSPNAAEREQIGYSAAWLHHKGRNKHHFEYWIDFSNDRTKGLVGNKMPLRYVIEMVCDRIAACKVYRGESYDSSAAWEYYARNRPFITPVLHPQTQALLEKLLMMLRDEGEEKTFAYIRRLLKRGTY